MTWEFCKAKVLYQFSQLICKFCTAKFKIPHQLPYYIFDKNTKCGYGGSRNGIAGQTRFCWSNLACWWGGVCWPNGPLLAKPGFAGQMGLQQAKPGLAGQTGFVGQTELRAKPGLAGQTGIAGQAGLRAKPGLAGQTEFAGTKNQSAAGTSFFIGVSNVNLRPQPWKIPCSAWQHGISTIAPRPI